MHEHRLNVAKVRGDFPILSRQVRSKPLVYLDNAATTQKPTAVIEALDRYYSDGNANVHRGVHLLSQEATRDYDHARARVRRFLNAGHSSEIIFTRGTTESINLVAATWGRAHIGAGDEIVISTMEHHSNIVPWQMLAESVGAVIRVIPITDAGELILEEAEKLIGPRTKLVSVVHVSNALGTVNPIPEVVAMARRAGALILVDGAQAVAHTRVDVRALDVDFYTLSGHKLFGPTGIGCLYGKQELLNAMPPYQGGGDMIETVSFERTTFARPPARFEAGTPHIAGAIGLSAAIEYVSSVGLDAISAYEHKLLDYATEAIEAIPGLAILGTVPGKAAVVSFVMADAHPHDVGTIVDMEGVAIRTGHHCAQPLMKRLGVPATSRASFAFYNTTEEVDALVRALHKVREVLG